MAELTTATGRGPGRTKRLSTKVDLTPMVDLGFLLITFFLFTTTLARPKTMSLTMPADGAPSPWREGQSMTLLLGSGHRIWYYEGVADGYRSPLVSQTGFAPEAGIRQVILKKMETVDSLVGRKILPAGSMALFLVKPDTGSTYADFVNLLDELNICGAPVKSVVDITPKDRALMSGR